MPFTEAKFRTIAILPAKEHPDCHFTEIPCDKIQRRICKDNTKPDCGRRCSFTARDVIYETSTSSYQWGAPCCKCDECAGNARPDYVTPYAYACINNVEPGRCPVKLRAYVGRESPVDCSAKRENRFWPLEGPCGKTVSPWPFPARWRQCANACAL